MNNFFFFETNLEDNENLYSYYFFNPLDIFILDNYKNIPEFFKKVEKYSKKYYLAGFLSFELGYTIEEALNKKLKFQSGFPLALFFVYKKPVILKYPEKLNFEEFYGDYEIKRLNLNMNFKEYEENLKKIKQYIRNGDIFQVNYTLKYKFQFKGSVFSFYNELKKRQKVSYNCFLNYNDFYILSISPELFFQKNGEYIRMKPMKGTVARGRNLDEDLLREEFLKKDIKNRSENLMIVDLIRNDLGKICEIGSVKVKSLFDIEKYETLFQMTSTIEGRLKKNINFYEIIKSIFPSGSVTGAPKIRSMEIINELEKEPRNIYTGSLGFISPDGFAKFNVTIRTILISNNYGEMGIGGGIVYDSDIKDEFSEAKLKAKFLLMWK